jgi:hypothetical protein
MSQLFYTGRGDGIVVRTRIVGSLEFDPATGLVRRLLLVTDGASYGKGRVDVAVWSVPWASARPRRGEPDAAGIQEPGEIQAGLGGVLLEERLSATGTMSRPIVTTTRTPATSSPRRGVPAQMAEASNEQRLAALRVRGLRRRGEDRRHLRRQFVHTPGRMLTYSFFSVAAGYAGFWLSPKAGTLVNVQAGLSMLARALLIYQGLLALGMLPRRHLLPTTATRAPALPGPSSARS